MQDLQAEMSVVGGCLLWPEYFPDAAAVLTSGDFTDHKNRALWDAMVAVTGRGDKIDPTPILAEIKRAGTMDRKAAMAYIRELGDAVPAGATVPNAARVVADAGRARRLDGALRTVSHRLTAGSMTADDASSELQLALDGVARPDSGAVSIGAALDQAAQQAEAIMTHGEPPSIMTGMWALDNLTGGMTPSEQVVLAARPSVGKTTLALNIAMNVARKGHGVVFYSMEMRARSLAINAQARETGLTRRNIYRGLTAEEFRAFDATRASLRHLPFWIVEDPGAGVRQVAAMAQSAARKQKLSLLVIDYLQLMHVDKADSRNLEIGKLAREMKRIALERDMVVLSLSQLSRGIEHRTDARPKLADLRDSGEIEAHADQVWMLTRPCRDLDPSECAARRSAGKLSEDNYACVYVRKHRNGETGRVDLDWDARRMMFSGNRVPEGV